MPRRLAAVPIVALLLAAFSGAGWTGVAHAAGQVLTYQVSDAEAYAYKASIAQPVIQAAPKCADSPFPKYGCDTYDHKPNCPKTVAFGPSAEPPDPQPPPNVDESSGGSGDTAGQDPNK